MKLSTKNVIKSVGKVVGVAASATLSAAGLKNKGIQGTFGIKNEKTKALGLKIAPVVQAVAVTAAAAYTVKAVNAVKAANAAKTLGSVGGSASAGVGVSGSAGAGVGVSSSTVAAGAPAAGLLTSAKSAVVSAPAKIGKAAMTIAGAKSTVETLLGKTGAATPQSSEGGGASVVLGGSQGGEAPVIVLPAAQAAEGAVAPDNGGQGTQVNVVPGEAAASWWDNLSTPVKVIGGLVAGWVALKKLKVL